MDFKTAFDSVNRKVLWTDMEEREIDEGLIERIKEIFIATNIRVKIGEKIGEEF